jgi:hypothetical protein
MLASLQAEGVELAKNVVLEDLAWSSLRRPVRDLVMLDVMNQPLILHNLKDRFAQNEIYVRLKSRQRVQLEQRCRGLVDAHSLFFFSLCVL